MQYAKQVAHRTAAFTMSGIPATNSTKKDSISKFDPGQRIVTMESCRKYNVYKTVKVVMFFTRCTAKSKNLSYNYIYNKEHTVNFLKVCLLVQLQHISIKKNRTKKTKQKTMIYCIKLNYIMIYHYFCVMYCT